MRAIAEEAFAIVREYKGTPLGRAWRRHRPLRVPRGHAGPAHRPRLRGGEGQLRPGRPLQPRQDRARRRAWTTAASSATGPATARSPLATALDWSAWGGLTGAVEMCNNNGACRKADPGVMCPSYRVTARRAARHPRPRQHAAPGAHGPARPGRLHLRRDVRDAGALRELQGLQARMPDRRRHGADEDRVPAPLPPAPRAAPEGPAGRLPAPLRAPGRPHGRPRQPARNRAGLRRAGERLLRASAPAAPSPAGAATSSGQPRLPRRTSPTSSSCRTPSRPTSSPRTPAPPCASSRPPATA